MLFYIYRSASGTLASMSADEVGTAFSDMLASPGAMVGWMILAVLIAFGICALGLQGGMEKIMKVMMSILIILIVILAIHSLVLPNAMEGVKFYLVPNLDAIKSRGLGAVVFDAMTHAFFTLSVGIGAMEIFGSYQKREHSIPGEAANIVILDTFVALMAGSPDSSSCHVIKYVRQCDKQQGRTCIRLYTVSKTCRNNDKSCH